MFFCIVYYFLYCFSFCACSLAMLYKANYYYYYYFDKKYFFQSFENPHAIAACPYGTALYVSEIGPNKIWKFDLV